MICTPHKTLLRDHIASRLAEHVPCIEKGNFYKDYVGIPERKDCSYANSFDGKPIITHVQSYEGVDWFHLAKDRDQCRFLLIMLVNSSLHKTREFLSQLTNY
jgi:hypothetical protein